MIISITGTPCTGKSTVSKLLSEKIEYELITFNEIAEKTKSKVGFDKKKDAAIVDVEKLKKGIKKLDILKGDKIIDGHLSHEIPSDLVIVLRCNPKVLESRLKNRYPENKGKVKENVESEILGVITSEAINSNENVYEIDVTGKDVTGVVREIITAVENEFEGQKIFVDWSEEYEMLLI